MKYVAKCVAKNTTFLLRFFIVFETKAMETYRFFDQALFGDMT